MSSNQLFGQFGGTANVRISKEFFEKLIRQIGTPLELYQKPQTVDCTCYSSTYNTPDPHCTVCGGTGAIGGWVQVPKHVFLGVLQFKDRKGRNDFQRLQGISGPVDTLEGVLYAESKWYDAINLGDIVVWKPEGNTKGHELRITSKDNQLGMLNKSVYVTFEVKRNATPIRIDAIDYKVRV